ncbi:MAG: hypothetical protein Kow0098_21730 [Ignavibacteriaceae bacterium]
MKNFSAVLFKYRSYTPVPFLIVMIFYEQAYIWTLIAGFIITAAGELLRLWGVSWAGSETRTTGNVGGTYLIVSGPFAYVRNPLYAGNILIYLGIGIMSFALFPYLQLAALMFFGFQYHLIVKEEEKFLLQKFESDYEKYKNEVPRFLPGFKKFKNPGIPQPAFSLKSGLKSEKRTLQAITIVVLIILIKWAVRTRIDALIS